VTVDYVALERAVVPEALIALDASVTLAYLAGTEAVSPAAAWLFDGCLAVGRNPAVLSTLTAAELLVRPFRASPAAVASVEGFLRFFDGIRLVDVTFPIAREAARVRATTNLPMPDAIAIATATDAGAAVIVTNDRRWPATIGPDGPTIIQLASFVAA